MHISEGGLEQVLVAKALIFVRMKEIEVERGRKREAREEWEWMQAFLMEVFLLH